MRRPCPLASTPRERRPRRRGEHPIEERHHGGAHETSARDAEGDHAIGTGAHTAGEGGHPETGDERRDHDPGADILLPLRHDDRDVDDRRREHEGGRDGRGNEARETFARCPSHGATYVLVGRDAWGRLAGMRGTWLRTRALGAFLVVLTAACTTTGIGHGPSGTVSPPTPSGASPTPAVSPTPSGSPVQESPLAVGVATVALSGKSTMSIGLSSIETPAVWAPPPAPMDITWSGGAVQRLHPRRDVVRQPRPDERGQGALVHRPGPGRADRVLVDGRECSVTITPALADNMGGVFS